MTSKLLTPAVESTGEPSSPKPIMWHTPRATNWHVKSSDGYWGITKILGKFSAFHIEAAFAMPKQIGHADSIEEAKQICEEYKAALKAAA